jgi:hypothetical protein
MAVISILRTGVESGEMAVAALNLNWNVTRINFFELGLNRKN